MNFKEGEFGEGFSLGSKARKGRNPIYDRQAKAAFEKPKSDQSFRQHFQPSQNDLRIASVVHRHTGSIPDVPQPQTSSVLKKPRIDPDPFVIPIE